MHRYRGFADDVQLGFDQKVIHFGDCPFQRVFHRYNAEIELSGLHFPEHVME